MKKHIIPFIFILTLICHSAAAQEIVFPSREYAEITISSKPPSILPDVGKDAGSWDNLLKKSVKSFVVETKHYGGVMDAYSLFAIGNYSPFPFKDNLMDKAFLKNTVYPVFSSEALRMALYDWVKPYYQNAFASLNLEYQRQFQSLLTGAKTYLDTFSLQKETARLKADENGFANKIGKLNAFLFRRISSKHFTVDECKVWIKRIMEDFTPLLKDATDPKNFYDNVIPVKFGLCIFEKKGKYGLLGPNGKEVLKAKYDYVDYFENDYLRVFDGQYFGLVNRTGNLITPVRYSIILKFNKHGLALVGNYHQYSGTGNWGFIDREGKEVIPVIYTVNAEPIADPESGGVIFAFTDHIEFTDGLIVLKKDSMWGVVDTLGKEVVPFIYDGLGIVGQDISGSLLFKANKAGHPSLYDKWKTESGKWGVIDITGKAPIPFEYSAIEQCGDTLRPAWLKVNIGGITDSTDNSILVGGKWGIIDLDGKVIAKPVYDSLENFSEGKANFTVGDKKGWLDKDGVEHWE